MLQSRIRIGIMGAARIARRSVAPALLELRDCFELVAIASSDLLKARQFAADFGIEAIDGYDALLARDDISAIYMPLPTGLHEYWIGKAIDAGKHVYAEKSFASNRAQAQQLVNAASVVGVSLMEGYMFLYHRQHLVVQEWLRQGRLGELRHYHGCFGFPPLPEDDFRYDENLGGGALMDAAGYPLRAAQLFLGDGLQVLASTVRRHPVTGASVWGSAFLESRRAVPASIAFGFDNHYQCRYELWGSLGKLTAERAFTPGPNFHPRLLLETAAGSETLNVEPDNHFIGAMREFHGCIHDIERRGMHYRQILSQSSALQDIHDLALSKGVRQ